MTVSWGIYRKIVDALSCSNCEGGGALGERNGMVVRFALDRGARNYSRAVYTPDTQYLNGVIERWESENIHFCGIVHGHPTGHGSLSSADVDYIEKIMRAMPEGGDKLFFPIVLPEKRMIPFLAVRSKEGIAFRKDELEIIRSCELLDRSNNFSGDLI